MPLFILNLAKLKTITYRFGHTTDPFYNETVEGPFFQHNLIKLSLRSSQPLIFFHSLFYIVPYLILAINLALCVMPSLSSLDSTMIDLCLELFQWANLRTTKSAVNCFSYTHEATY